MLNHLTNTTNPLNDSHNLLRVNNNTSNVLPNIEDKKIFSHEILEKKQKNKLINGRLPPILKNKCVIN